MHQLYWAKEEEKRKLYTYRKRLGCVSGKWYTSVVATYATANCPGIFQLVPARPPPLS